MNLHDKKKILSAIIAIILVIGMVVPMAAVYLVR